MSDLKVSGFQTEQILSVTKYQYFSSRNCQKVDQMRKLSWKKNLMGGRLGVCLYTVLLRLIFASCNINDFRHKFVK